VTGEQKPGTFWTTLPGILTGFAAVLTASAAVVGALAAIGVFDRATASPTPTPSPGSGGSPTSTPAVLVSCTGDLETGIGGTLSVSQPTYVATRDMCVTAVNLYETTAGTGVATIKLDGATVYSIDLDNFDTIGEEGAGSGERRDRLGRVIGLASGQALSLDFSECVNCGGLSVYFEAAPR
jgi:hypothetical protein